MVAVLQYFDEREIGLGLRVNRYGRPAAVGRFFPMVSRLGEVVAGPSLVFGLDGFTSSTSARAQGGWFVSWLEQRSGERRLIGVRVAEDGMKALTESVDLAGGVLREPFTFVKQQSDGTNSLHYGYLTDDALHLNRASCEMGD